MRYLQFDFVQLYKDSILFEISRSAQVSLFLRCSVSRTPNRRFRVRQYLQNKIKAALPLTRLLVCLPEDSWWDCFRRGRWQDFALGLNPPPGSRFTSLATKVSVFAKLIS